MTDEDVRQFTKKTFSLVITAGSVTEMHRKLNTLRTNGSKNWQLLRQPTWRGDKLIAVAVRPDPDLLSKK